MRLIFSLFLIATCCRMLAAEHELRTWTSKSGSTIEAKLARDEGYRIVLKKENGKLTRITAASLSQEDQDYLAKLRDAPRIKAAEDALATQGFEKGMQEVELPPSLGNSKALSSKYLLFIPEDYGGPKEGMPLILFLHGAGERGNNIQQVGKNGIAKIAKKKKDFPFITVSPQCRKDQYWNRHPDDLKKLLDHVIDTLEVDESRLYLTGLSMGGYGSWAMACAYPKTFAAVAPICGGGNPGEAKKIRDLPIWVFHGDKDKTVSIDSSQRMVDALKQAGSEVKFTIYPGVGHNSWTKAYADPELYTWFLSNKRDR